MDLAVYISELLGLQGEVNVPGMGNFAQIRINGYFNEQEKKFYPPAHEVNFKLQSTGDDQLANYIADKKNISLASANYFIEKYVTGAKLEAETKEVEIDGLGHLYTNNSVLTFRADGKKANDPAFFGLPPVSVYQTDEIVAPVYTPPVVEERTEEPAIIETVDIHEVQQEVVIDVPPTIIEHEEQEEYQEEYVDDQPRRKINTGIILLMFIIIVILGLTGVYIYKPSVIEEIIDKVHSEPAKKTPVVTTPQVIKKDTTKSTGTDTITKTTAPVTTSQQTAPQTINPVVDTLAVLHYEISGGAYKILSKAKPIMDNYTRLGLTPRILKRSSHKLYKITLGTYFNIAQAIKVKDSILNIPKINKQEISLETYKAKK